MKRAPVWAVQVSYILRKTRRKCVGLWVPLKLTNPQAVDPQRLDELESNPRGDRRRIDGEVEHISRDLFDPLAGSGTCNPAFPSVLRLRVSFYRAVRARGGRAPHKSIDDARSTSYLSLRSPTSRHNTAAIETTGGGSGRELSARSNVRLVPGSIAHEMRPTNGTTINGLNNRY